MPSFPEPAVRPWRDRPQSSIYDPFAGMKTPGQRQLITLQEQVKLGIVNVDEAVLHFKEWQLNQKKRSESFRFQQVSSSLWTLLQVSASGGHQQRLGHGWPCGAVTEHLWSCLCVWSPRLRGRWLLQVWHGCRSEADAALHSLIPCIRPSALLPSRLSIASVQSPTELSHFRTQREHGKPPENLIKRIHQPQLLDCQS